MYHITYNDGGTLEYYMSEKIAYPNAEYDFTFEKRFLVYHAPMRNEWSYLVLDMRTKRTSEACCCKVPLKNLNHKDFIPYVLAAIRYTGDRRYYNCFQQNPTEVIDTIFREVLPQYGYYVREEQVALCKRIFNGLSNYSASICEAEVGTGKTLAYLIAAVAARMCYGLHEPITITTANIELQKALIEKEIPRLSKILMDNHFIYEPLIAVLRKGKEHYFCRFRYEDYVSKIRMFPEKFKDTLDFFERTDFARSTFDLDMKKIPASLKGKVSVKGQCGGCKYEKDCRYRWYVNNANRGTSIFFQVTNHNLFLTSERLRYTDGGRILCPSNFVIIDEAHKLKEASAEAFGESLGEDEIPRYVNTVQHLCDAENKQQEYKKHLKAAIDLNCELFNHIKRKISDEDCDSEKGSLFKISRQIQDMIRELGDIIRTIEASRKKVSGGYGIHGERIVHTLDAFSRPGSIITWAENDENGKTTFCCCPKNVGKVMYDNVWSGSAHYILMSGTMSDGRDFSYFQKENGLIHLPKNRIQTSFSTSPFDYAKNTRLYIPEDMPMPDNNTDAEYIAAISERIVELVKATNGHTAILFTSYKALNAVYEMTRDRLSDYELICMTRSNRTAIGDFKKSRNAVLFASGSMWEGVDFVGDSLSSVIIVRLPFPIRSATMEEKKSASTNVTAFIDEYAVPEMLIKLRQGVGRLIRSETDTGLISILDPRALNSKYADRTLEALSKYPRVKSLREIEDYFRKIKPSEYFEE